MSSEDTERAVVGYNSSATIYVTNNSGGNAIVNFSHRYSSDPVPDYTDQAHVPNGQNAPAPGLIGTRLDDDDDASQTFFRGSWKCDPPQRTNASNGLEINKNRRREWIMSSNCNITNLVNNQTTYSFTLVSAGLDSGDWVVSPQPIPAGPMPPFNAFQAKGVSGTATGAVGHAIYDVVSDGVSQGTLQFDFDDPYSGNNHCSSKTTVSGLNVSNNCPENGSDISVIWTLTS